VLFFFVYVTLFINIRYVVFYEVQERWKWFALIYWCKTFYQVASIPFLILKIPGLKVFLTHSKKTGYKPNGTLVLHKKKPKDD